VSSCNSHASESLVEPQTLTISADAEWLVVAMTMPQPVEKKCQQNGSSPKRSTVGIGGSHIFCTCGSSSELGCVQNETHVEHPSVKGNVQKKSLGTCCVANTLSLHAAK